MADYDVLESSKVFDGIILSVHQEKVMLPNGASSTYEIVKKNSATALVAVLDDGKILFVRQYRPAIKKYTLELPAGTFNKSEDAKQCGIRELEEETGFIAGRVEFLTKIYVSVGFCDEVLHIYLAEDLTVGKQNLDEDEFLTIEKYTLDEAIEMIFNGTIEDAKTVSGILAYKQKNKK